MIRKKKHEIDPYPTYLVQIQKMRLTKVNELPQSFVFTNHGIEIIGSNKIEKKLVDSAMKQESLNEKTIIATGNLFPPASPM